MPEDYVLSMAINRTTGFPVGPRGTIHCLVVAISVCDAYNGLTPPSCAHGASGHFSYMHRRNDTIMTIIMLGLAIISLGVGISSAALGFLFESRLADGGARA